MNAPLKADVTAAERLLKAAVREAARAIREAPVTMVDPGNGKPPRRLYGWDYFAVVNMLAEAGRSADLLLSERAS
jgi:hypothetical protein